ncbi:MAG: glutamate racemase [Bacteroidaceae bacterium]|nr:glutamate racemase [Bacteroidaceae bacterium]
MAPIGIFDSGYGGLTILRQIRKLMPQYDYLYLGDNARAPYGPRSFQLVYEFTLQAVRRLFDMGCPLIILGCNTASAKALRTIQQRDLPLLFPPHPSQPDAEAQLPSRRVLGVIRPTAECVGQLTHTRHVGIVATQGTIASRTYELEIAKLHPDIVVTGEACPMWVPLVENYEFDSAGADYFVRKNLDHLLSRDPQIDAIILGCTHFPLLLDKIRRYVPEGVQIIPQGHYVAQSLADYLSRHPYMEARLTRTGVTRFLTTEQADTFNTSAAMFLSAPVQAERITL